MDDERKAYLRQEATEWGAWHAAEWLRNGKDPLENIEDYADHWASDEMTDFPTGDPFVIECCERFEAAARKRAAEGA